MDVENRRIVLSIAERLKDMGEEAVEEFINGHPRLEDVVAADVASGSEGGAVPNPDDADRAEDEALAREAAEFGVAIIKDPAGDEGEQQD